MFYILVQPIVLGIACATWPGPDLRVAVMDGQLVKVVAHRGVDVRLLLTPLPAELTYVVYVQAYRSDLLVAPTVLRPHELLQLVATCDLYDPRTLHMTIATTVSGLFQKRACLISCPGSAYPSWKS